jgi:hypothetical protein
MADGVPGESGLGDADDGELNSVQFDGLRQQVGRTTEPAAPEAVADDRDGPTSGCGDVACGERPAEHDASADRIEVVVRHEADRHLLGRFPAAARRAERSDVRGRRRFVKTL